MVLSHQRVGVSVEANIALVQAIFGETRDQYPLIGFDYLLNNAASQFISVYYEAAAAHLAKEDLLSGALDFVKWSEFKNKHGQSHESQIHVGLGWAMAETDNYNEPFVNSLAQSNAWRVIDGFAYYQGLFMRREAIRNQLVPNYIPNSLMPAYSEGIGRSLWYISQGSEERLIRSINIFSDERKPDLWRGVGIAATYVGGNKMVHEKLSALSGVYAKDFICGCIMALESIDKTGVTRNDLPDLGENQRLVQSLSGSSNNFDGSIKQITAAVVI